MNLPISLYVALRYWRAKAPIVLGDLFIIGKLWHRTGCDGIDYCAFCHEWIEGYQNSRCFRAFRMRLLAKKRLFRQKTA